MLFEIPSSNLNALSQLLNAVFDAPGVSETADQKIIISARGLNNFEAIVKDKQGRLMTCFIDDKEKLTYILDCPDCHSTFESYKIDDSCRDCTTVLPPKYRVHI